MSINGKFCLSLISSYFLCSLFLSSLYLFQRYLSLSRRIKDSAFRVSLIFNCGCTYNLIHFMILITHTADVKHTRTSNALQSNSTVAPFFVALFLAPAFPSFRFAGLLEAAIPPAPALPLKEEAVVLPLCFSANTTAASSATFCSSPQAKSLARASAGATGCIWVSEKRKKKNYEHTYNNNNSNSTKDKVEY